MAEPDTSEIYIRFKTEHGLVVFVSQDVLVRQEPGATKLRFYIGGYGRYWLSLPRGWQEAHPSIGGV